MMSSFLLLPALFATELAKAQEHPLFSHQELDGIRSLDTIHEDYARARVYKIPYNAESYSIGDPRKSSVHITVFFDLQCPFCQNLYEVLEELATTVEEELSLTFLHYPLSPQCNPFLTQNLHPFACALHRGLWATQKQNPELVHSYILSAHEALERFTITTIFEQIVALAVSLGLDGKVFAEDLKSDAARKAILNDINRANSFQSANGRRIVTGTPTIFINGRLLLNPVAEKGTWADGIAAISERTKEKSP